jgi:hypothetical protein
MHAKKIFETANPAELPELRAVNVIGPNHKVIQGFKGIERMDTKEVISIMSERYGLVQHRFVADMVTEIAQAFPQPDVSKLGWDTGSEAGDVRARAGIMRYAVPHYALYDHGRKLDARLVIGDKHKLQDGEEFYPGVRIRNSLDGTLSVRVMGFALRLGCTNQLHVGSRAQITDLRQLHLASNVDLLAQIQKGIYEFLDKFDSMLDIYNDAMNTEIDGADVEPALISTGMPKVHARVIGDRCDALTSHNIMMPCWEAYQVATGYITHEVEVSPTRQSQFERAAASALLLTEESSGSELAEA